MLKKHSKLTFDPVVEEVYRLWDKGYSVHRITDSMRISETGANKLVKGRVDKDRKLPTRKRTFDRHKAYCLLHEHGLSYKQAAFALGIKIEILRTIMNRYKHDIETSYPQWKEEQERNKVEDYISKIAAE